MKCGRIIAVSLIAIIPIANSSAVLSSESADVRARIDSALQKSNTSFVQNRFHDAARLATEALALSPNNIKALQARGRAQEFRGNAELAVRDLESAFKLAPKEFLSTSYEALALAYIDQNLKQKAAQVIELGLRNKPSSNLYKLRADMEMVAHNDKGALHDFEEAAKLDQYCRSCHLAHGKLSENAKQFVIAVKDYSTVIRISFKLNNFDRQYTAALRNRARVYEALGNKAAAHKDLEQLAKHRDDWKDTILE